MRREALRRWAHRRAIRLARAAQQMGLIALALLAVVPFAVGYVAASAMSGLAIALVFIAESVTEGLRRGWRL